MSKPWTKQRPSLGPPLQPVFSLLVFKPIHQRTDIRQNLHRKLIARPDGDFGLPHDPHPGRRARDNQRARGQRGALREKADELGDREDQIVRPAVLEDLSVLEAADVQRGWVGDQGRRHEGGPNGTGAVEALGEAPLGLCELARPAGDVVARRVAEDIGQGVGFGDVLGGLAQDDGEFGLVVAAVVLLGEFGEDGR